MTAPNIVGGHTVQTLPVFATVGFRKKPIRPIPIDDLTDILVAAIDRRMPRETVAVVEQIRSAMPEPGGFGWRDLRIGG